MAAPKGAGCFFGGDLQGGAETRSASAGPHARLAGNRLARQTKQNPGRRGARPASLSRCLREHAGQEEIGLLQAFGDSGQMLCSAFEADVINTA
jgi:hypothetical protein